MLDNRLLAARELIERCDLDALVFFDLRNVRYFCGFTGTDGALVLTARSSCFTTDSRYTTQAREQVSADEIREHKDKLDGVIAYLKEVGSKRIGFEADTLPFGTAEKLRERSPCQWQWEPLGEKLNALRSCKDDDEVRAMEAATRLNAEALEEIVPQIRPGVPERDVALALEFALKRRGGEEKAFDFIVASGKRGAMPHGIASEKLLEEGELVTVDFGTRVDGYHSDETVTFALGEVAAEARRIYDVVLEAHDRAMAAVRPGIELCRIDAIARDYIADQGYGDYFGHGLGHGVGLDVHEAPVVSPRSKSVAEPGMVITIEPGIYIPDFGGVRIEDMVLVTDDGFRRLTVIDKKFRILAV